jgi:hypothetical protein
MSFNSNIPQATDLISVSQQDLLNNFTSMQSTYTTDHYGFNPLTNLGYHKQITLVDDPLVVRSTAAGRLTEYAVTTNSQTYPVLQRDGTTTVYQALPIKAYCTFTAANPPVSLFTLPYGNVSAITRLSAGVYRVTFVDAFPAFAPNATYMALTSINFAAAFLAQWDVTASSATQAVIKVITTSGVGPNVDIGNYISVAFLS